MAVILTEEQQGIKEMVRSFMEKSVKPHISEYDKSGEFPVELYKQGFEIGLHIMNIPEEFGGLGLDNVTMAVALEEMGRVDPGFAITMLSTSLTLKDVLVGGTKEQKQRAADIIIPGAHEDKMGLRLSNTVTMFLDNVRVPASNMLGQVGDGIKIALHGLDAGRLYNSAISVGIAQHAIEEATAYAKERVQFGKPIIENQAIQMMLADMQRGTEAARCMVHNSMRLMDMGVENVSMEASCCKAFASDNAVKCATDAVQVLGGYGYSKEYPVEKIMRDSKIFQIFEGTNQIQRLVIARQMAKLY